MGGGSDLGCDPVAAVSFLVDRDEDLEARVLLSVARVAQEPGFPIVVQRRLDEVENGGGPDGPGARCAVDAFREAVDEFVDAAAWAIVGLNRLAVDLENGDIDPQTAIEARALIEEAMAHAAHGGHLMRGAVAILEGG